MSVIFSPSFSVFILMDKVGSRDSKLNLHEFVDIRMDNESLQNQQCPLDFMLYYHEKTETLVRQVVVSARQKKLQVNTSTRGACFCLQECSRSAQKVISYHQERTLESFTSSWYTGEENRGFPRGVCLSMSLQWCPVFCLHSQSPNTGPWLYLTTVGARKSQIW